MKKTAVSEKIYFPICSNTIYDRLDLNSYWKRSKDSDAWISRTLLISCWSCISSCSLRKKSKRRFDDFFIHLKDYCRFDIEKTSSLGIKSIPKILEFDENHKPENLNSITFLEFNKSPENQLCDWQVWRTIIELTYKQNTSENKSF